MKCYSIRLLLARVEVVPAGGDSSSFRPVSRAIFAKPQANGMGKGKYSK